MCTCKGTENQTKDRSYQNLICSVLSRDITQCLDLCTFITSLWINQGFDK